ncbi:PQQ-like beta-propeller repeat protein [bacterium]|nr:PQQ-like beta-propeller repeat protein [bacterium]
MNNRLIAGAITIVAALGGAAAIVFWLAEGPGVALVESVPGMDGRAAALSNAPAVKIGEFFAAFDGVAATNILGSWPRFRGANFDNICADGVKLADKWPEGGPRILWSVELGEGHAAPAVANGRVYLLDYDEKKKQDALRCFSLGDGREIWRRSYTVRLKRNHGMSRTIPAVSDGHVVTIGPNCHVMCVKADTGDFAWGIDLVREYGTKVPGWYTGQCPLIDNGLAIIAPAGTNVLMMAVECATGKIVWQTPNARGWLMSHSSIMPWSFGGRKMYVYAASGGIAGIAADGPDAGAVLWETTAFSHNVVAPAPVCLPDGRVFMTAGYGAGSMMLKVMHGNGAYTVETLQTLKPNEGLACEQQTPLYFEGCLFGILPKDAGPRRNELVCCSPDDCSTFVWTSSKEHRFGLGPFMIADGKFLILNDNGELTMARATTNAYIKLASAKIMDGKDAWGPFALVDGRLLMRDDKHMVCLDLRTP